MWTCISQVAVRIFTRYLAQMKAKPLDTERESIMDMHAQFLLVTFTRIHKSLRIVADEFLSMLAKDGRVLFTMLDVAQLLSQSLEVVSDNSFLLSSSSSSSSSYILEKNDIFLSFIARCSLFLLF
ncbi:unnamed protein product [Trichobilharzia regenti]|nr:unnamed protein product [Trichobilharzia regenti]